MTAGDIDDPVAAPPGGETTGRPMEVAVVGAGLSGLACARTLTEHGHRATVFDKARGPGGRTTTRRAGSWQFDHGAQYFTVRDRQFARAVEALRREGVVEPWRGRIAVVEAGAVRLKDDSTERFVGVPGMNALCRRLGAGLEVRLETPVAGLERRDGLWQMTADDGCDLGCFEAVVVSAPAPQTAALLELAAPSLSARAAAVEMAPCWAVMVAFSRPLGVAFDGAFVHGSPLSWVARNGSKPGRPDGEAWVLHGSPEWSRRNLELEPREAGARLLEAFGSAIGGLESEPARLDAHRWRFALPIEPLPEPCLVDDGLRLAACGDWCGGPRVEGAYLSGLAAAERILRLGPAGAHPQPTP